MVVFALAAARRALFCLVILADLGFLGLFLVIRADLWAFLGELWTEERVAVALGLRYLRIEK